jgi:Domain of unknown function (DUF4377)
VRRTLGALLFVSSLTACSAPTELEFERILTLQVAAQTMTCQQWYGPEECLQVRSDAADAWEPLYFGIVGFTHEEGFEYELRVAEFTIRNPPADGSSRELRLVRIVKRVQVPPA